MKFFLNSLLLFSLLPGYSVAFHSLPTPTRVTAQPSVLERPFQYRRFSARGKSPTLLHQASDNTVDQEPEDNKRESIVRGYLVSKKLYLLLSLILLGLTRDYRKFTSVSGFFMAAGLSHILSVSTKHDRLTSDTYKRLNIGLIGYNILSLLAIPGEVRIFLGTAKAYIYSLCALLVQSYGAHMAYKGWQRGLGTEAHPSRQLAEGIKSTIKTTLPTKERGTVYRNFLLFFLGESLYMVYKIAASLRVSGLLQASLLTGAFARRCLIVTMLYSLKDAGERDRLKGTTFIQMDYLIGMWLFLIGLGQLVYPGAALVTPPAVLFSCGSMFMIGGYLNQQEKKGNVEHAESTRRFAVDAVVEVIEEE